MFLDLLFLVAGGGGYHQCRHNTIGAGASCTGGLVEVAVTHWHHALAYIAFGPDQDDVELKRKPS